MGDAWAVSTSTPATVNHGGALVWVGPTLYALRGDGAPDFWRAEP